MSKVLPKIDVLTKRLTLGEGPHWDIPKQCLYFVDILGQTINKYVPATKKHTSARIEGGPVSLLVPVEGSSDRFLISIGRKLVIVTWDGVSSTISKKQEILEVDNETGYTENRFNDGKADPNGRLWAGTMGPEPEIGKLDPEKGSLYTLISKTAVKKHLEKVSIANGLAWNLNLKKMYYIDSPRRTVDAYDYDMMRGEIRNRTVVFDLEKHNIPGVPDGMTIDDQGNLWVAVFNGSRIIQINPRTSELLNTIYFPCTQITAICFGGQNFEDMYVTSARLTIAGVECAEPAGCLFKVTGHGARGLPSYNVKYDSLK